MSGGDFEKLYGGERSICSGAAEGVLTTTGVEGSKHGLARMGVGC